MLSSVETQTFVLLSAVDLLVALHQIELPGKGMEVPRLVLLTSEEFQMIMYIYIYMYIYNNIYMRILCILYIYIYTCVCKYVCTFKVLFFLFLFARNYSISTVITAARHRGKQRLFQENQRVYPGCAGGGPTGPAQPAEEHPAAADAQRHSGAADLSQDEM